MYSRWSATNMSCHLMTLLEFTAAKIKLEELLKEIKQEAICNIMKDNKVHKYIPLCPFNFHCTKANKNLAPHTLATTSIDTYPSHDKQICPCDLKITKKGHQTL